MSACSDNTEPHMPVNRISSCAQISSNHMPYAVQHSEAEGMYIDRAWVIDRAASPLRPHKGSHSEGGQGHWLDKFHILCIPGALICLRPAQGIHHGVLQKPGQR